MKFAIISADGTHKKGFTINPEQGDATSFFNWIDVLGGVHLSFLALREEDNSYLKDFDVIMMSGHLNHLTDIIRIAEYLKDSKTITMFYPEGSAQLYDNSINGFHREFYDAWNACDILSIAEEDKIGYYKAFIRSETIVRFVHVPLRHEMEMGDFMRPWSQKKKEVAIVYGDNNPNHPMIAMACAKMAGMDAVLVDSDRGKLRDIMSVFPSMRFASTTKLAQYPFLRVLSEAGISFYPTEWIGTARHQISCAVTGTICIGNHDSHTQRRLYPDWLSFDIYDVDGMVSAAKRIMASEMEYDSVSETAFEKVQFYNLKNTMKRFTSAIHDAKNVKHKVSVPT